MKKLMFFFIFISHTSMAANQVPTLLNESHSSVDFMKMMFGLLMVVALIFLLAFVVKRMNVVGIGNGYFFKIISTISLGTRDKLILVKAGDNYLLLGVSANGITKLHDYGSEINLADIQKQTPSFFDVFNKAKKT